MTCRIGLTGGIGSGKSTVAALFKQCGATIVDSDDISRRLTQYDGQAMPAIHAAFGNDYLDTHGALNRTRMRHLIFSDPAAKTRLETILHPLVRTQILALSAAAKDTPYVLLVIPLLFEAAGYDELVQRILVVDCTEEDQIARTLQRSGLDEQTVRSIMAQQFTRTERLIRADDIIHNDNNIDYLLPQVAQLHQRYLAFSAGSD